MAQADREGSQHLSTALGFVGPGTHVHPRAELPKVRLPHHCCPTPSPGGPSADDWSSSTVSPAQFTQYKPAVSYSPSSTA